MTESNISVMSCRAVVDNSCQTKPVIAIQEKTTITAGEPKPKVAAEGTITESQSKSLPAMPLAFVPPDPEALSKGITLTEDDVDDIDAEIVKDARESKRNIFRDVIIAKRNGAGLPRLPKEEEDREIEKMEVHYYEKTNQETQDQLQEYEIVSIGDFLQQKIEEPKQLIKNLLYKGDEMCVGSGSKSYKMFTLLDLGVSIASGSPWLGMDTTQGKVLFVNFELKPFTIQKRIKAILEARNLMNNTITFDLMNRKGKLSGYKYFLPKLIDRIKANSYDCIILDPIYKLYEDTEENSNSDIIELLNQVEPVAVKAGAAIVFASHFSKGNQSGKEAIDRVGGAGSFGRHVDVMVTFTKHAEEDSYTVEGEQRDFKRIDPFVVTFNYPLMWRNTCLNPANLKTPVMKTPAFTTDMIIRELAQENLSTAELQKRLLKNSGMKDATFFRLWKSVRDMEGIEKTTSGKWSYNNPDPQNRLN